MTHQMNYIIKEKALTEERIINGTTLLRKELTEYNKLLEFTKKLKDDFFDLYFQAKAQNRSMIPVSDDELRLFRKVDDMESKRFLD